MEYPPMEIFKIQLDTVLSNLFQLTLFEQGVGPEDLQKTRPTSTIL